MLKVSRSIAIALTVSLFLAACAAMQQQKAQASRADTGEFHNLQVFPQNITHDELIASADERLDPLGGDIQGPGSLVHGPYDNRPRRPLPRLARRRFRRGICPLRRRPSRPRASTR